MKVAKALFGALTITIISCILLTLTKGVPTTEQLLWNSWQMFAVAFVVLLFYNKKQS